MENVVIEIGLLVCGSNASNPGAITARAALKIAKEYKKCGYSITTFSGK